MAMPYRPGSLLLVLAPASLWAIRDDPYREYNRTQDTNKLYIEQLKPENNGRGIILIPYVLHNTVADEYILLSL